MKTSASAANQHEMKDCAASTLEVVAGMQTDREPEGGVASEKRWYVARTQPRAEGRAIANLEKQNFRTFCPRFRKSRQHARRVENVLVPLFPSYIFVRLDLSRDRWRSVNGLRTICRFRRDTSAARFSWSSSRAPVPTGTFGFSRLERRSLIAGRIIVPARGILEGGWERQFHPDGGSLFGDDAATTNKRMVEQIIEPTMTRLDITRYV
jgi:hypothetical protein